MSPEAMNSLEQWARMAVTLSPLLLLAFKSVRGALARLTGWLWRPLAEQFARRDQLLRAIQEDVGAMRAQLSVVVGTLRLQADNAEEVGFFECDEQGRNTNVNRTYCRWMHCAPAQLLDWGFLGFIHPTQREAVRAEWLACIRDHRDYRTRFRMGSPEHGYREYDVVARPIPDSPPAIAWAGTIRPTHRRLDEVEAGQPATDWRHDTGV